jgi:hypothetical protein
MPANIFSLTAPTSVRVARWAAVAAAITALGSVFDTMWSQKPWWADEQPAPIVQVVSKYQPRGFDAANDPAKKNYYSEKSEKSPETAGVEQVQSASSPVHQFHIEKWFFYGAVFIGSVYVIVEYFWDRIRKKREKLFTERGERHESA